jgi:hypothetical protein
MKVWITKYALTQGIRLASATIADSTKNEIRVRDIESYYPEFFNKGEWFDNEQDAKADAEKRRLKQINLLKKQLIKLENMRF